MKPPMRSELKWQAPRVASRAGVRALRRAIRGSVERRPVKAEKGHQAEWSEADAVCAVRRPAGSRPRHIPLDLHARTLRRVAILAGMLVLFACAARAAEDSVPDTASVNIAQPVTVGNDSTHVHVIDQSDPSQYDEVWDWGAEWRMLRWYGQTLVIAAGVLLLPVLWCGAALCAGMWKLARARRQLARAHRLEAAVHAAFRAIDAQRQHLEREVGRML